MELTDKEIEFLKVIHEAEERGYPVTFNYGDEEKVNEYLQLYGDAFNSLKLADYILQINEASSLNRKFHSISECAKKLHQSFPELSIHTCKSRIYDAINYLNQDCTVTSEAWYLYYADMFMKLFEVNLVGHNFREARNCLQKSCEYRIKASANAIDPDRIKFKHQIVSADMELARMGVKKQGILNAYKKAGVA